MFSTVPDNSSDLSMPFCFGSAWLSVWRLEERVRSGSTHARFLFGETSEPLGEMPRALVAYAVHRETFRQGRL